MRTWQIAVAARKNSVDNEDVGILRTLCKMQTSIFPVHRLRLHRIGFNTPDSWPVDLPWAFKLQLHDVRHRPKGTLDGGEPVV